MRIWARKNHVGWIHLWTRPDGYAEGQPSDHFVNGRTDAYWREVVLDPDAQAALERGELVELDDPGYFAGEESP